MKLLFRFRSLLWLLPVSLFSLHTQERLHGKHSIELPANVQQTTCSGKALALAQSSAHRLNILIQHSAIPSEGERAALATKGSQLGAYLRNRASWSTLREGVEVRSRRLSRADCLCPPISAKFVSLSNKTNHEPLWETAGARFFLVN